MKKEGSWDEPKKSHRAYHGRRWFFSMMGMPFVCGESPQGAQLPAKPIATCKARIVRCGRLFIRERHLRHHGKQIMVNKIKTASRSAKDFDFHFCCFKFTPPIFYYKSAANGQLQEELPVRGWLLFKLLISILRKISCLQGSIRAQYKNSWRSDLFLLIGTVISCSRAWRRIALSIP